MVVVASAGRWSILGVVLDKGRIVEGGSQKGGSEQVLK